MQQKSDRRGVKAALQKSRGPQAGPGRQQPERIEPGTQGDEGAGGGQSVADQVVIGQANQYPGGAGHEAHGQWRDGQLDPFAQGMVTKSLP